MTAWVLVAGLGLLAAGGEPGEMDFRPSAHEAQVPALFRLEPAVFRYEVEPVLTAARYRVSRVRFPSPITTPVPENNVVHAEWFDPVGFTGKRPAVVVLHILGSDFPLSRYLAARLADRGVAALFVKLPYYGERRPRQGPGPVPSRFLSADMERTMTSMRQGVCDVRRGLAWLARQPNVDPTRLGVTGISLGGIVAALTVAVAPEARQGVFLLAGGDLSRILWEMPETRPFRRAWEESGKTIHDLKALTDPYDPVTYAGRLAGKRVLMLAGNVDEVVPPASTLALWKAAQEPPIRWYDCGHYSAVGFLLPAIRATTDFLADPPALGQPGGDGRTGPATSDTPP